MDDTCFKVSIIPHTAEETTLLKGKPGTVVNLENDIVGKYVDKLLHFDEMTGGTEKNQARKAAEGLTWASLLKTDLPDR